MHATKDGAERSMLDYIGWTTNEFELLSTCLKNWETVVSF